MRASCSPARSEGALRQLVNEIKGPGGRAVHVVADVAKREDVRKVAQAAEEEFGGFDTWVNNAGISIYGRVEDVDLEDMRRLFETNFWGLVYGSLEGVKRLKRRGGGALITSTSAAWSPSARCRCRASTRRPSTR